MGLLILGFFSGLVCFLTTLFLGAGWGMSLLVYAVTGSLSILINAIVVARDAPLSEDRAIGMRPARVSAVQQTLDESDKRNG